VERLIVDGYNIIFAWPELSALKDVNLQDARELLIATMADYAAMTRQKVTIVFDSHRRPDAEASEQTVSGVQVVYSGRKTSADHVIERLLFEAKAGDEVTVATSDALQRPSKRRWMGCWPSATSRWGTPALAPTSPAAWRTASTPRRAKSSTGCGAVNRRRNKKRAARCGPLLLARLSSPRARG
jgi:hypothetical protein